MGVLFYTGCQWHPSRDRQSSSILSSSNACRDSWKSASGTSHCFAASCSPIPHKNPKTFGPLFPDIALFFLSGRKML